MRLSTFGVLAVSGLLLAPLSPALAQAPAVPVTRTAQPLARALADVRRLYGTEFVYEERLLTGKNTSVQVVRGRSVEELLKAMLYPNGLVFLYVDKNHYTIVARDARAELTPDSLPAATGAGASATRTLSGYVQDDKGGALPGATVLTGTDSRTGVATNADGRFLLTVTTGTQTIRVSSVGYESQVITLTSTNFYPITLKAQATGLDEVQVVSNGYVELPRERATGAYGIVTSEQLGQIPVPNVIQRLEGQVAGVQLNIQSSDNSFLYQFNQVNPKLPNNSGMNDYGLTVRGRTTLNSDPGATKPLIVVDGLPTELDLRTLNPDDIAQITVLKDAAAASIWGVRAANGVLVVQTKKGRFNRAPTVSFNTSFTQYAQPRVDALRLLDAAQTINYEQELVDRSLLIDPGPLPTNPGTTYFPRPVTEAQEWMYQAQRGTATVAQRDSALAVLASRGRTGYDQVRQYLLRPASAQTYDISLSGGGTNNTFFVSAAYAREKASTIGNDGSRFTLTANQEFKFFNRFTLTLNGRGSFFNQNQGGIGLAPLVTGLTEVLPYNQLVNSSGQSVDYSYAYYAPKLAQLQSRGYLPWTYNYLTERDLVSNSSQENNYWGALGLSAPLVGGLSASVLYSQERTYGENPTYYSPDSYYARNLLNSATSVNAATGRLVYGVPLGGILTRSSAGRSNYTLRGQLTLDRNFGGRHQVNAVGGAEIREVNLNSLSQTFFGYNDQSQQFQQVNFVQPYTNVQGQNSTLTNSADVLNRRTRYLSYFANGSYTLLERYTASASVRYDDYSNFGLDRKYRATPLYSAGLAWTIKQEEWLKNVAWLSTLRLRATYGLNGNIAGGAVPYTSIFLVPNNPLTNQAYASINAPANPTLRWERTAVSNLGIDFGLWGSRLTGAVEAYYKRSTDLYVAYPFNPTYGFSTLARNAANLNGQGIDLTLNGSLLRTTKWDWSLMGVASYNTNKVVDYQVDNTATVLASGVSGPLNNRPTDYLMTFRSAGLDSNGRTLVYDRNEGIVNSNQALTSLDDLHYAGRQAPAYTGGLSQRLRYKGLSLFIQTVFKFDYVFLPPTFNPLDVTRGISLSSDIDRRWRQAGDEAFTNVPGVPGSTGNSYTRYVYSDSRVQRGDHVRLREVSLSYALPSHLLGFGSTTPFVKNVTLSAAARNLGLLWRRNTLGIDPDFLSPVARPNLPPSVSYVFSLNASF
jgi:TonB-linked SusC/RagA family outer membrane protein